MKKGIFIQYIAIVCDKYDLTEDELFNTEKRRKYSLPRHVFFYLVSARGIKVYEIIEWLDERGYSVDHSRISKGVKRVKELMSRDLDYVKLFDKIDLCVVV